MINRACVPGRLQCQHEIVVTPFALFLQGAECPRQDDAAVERRLPDHMTQRDHAAHTAQPSGYQANPRVPAVRTAPDPEPQKRRPGRPTKVRGPSCHELVDWGIVIDCHMSRKADSVSHVHKVVVVT